MTGTQSLMATSPTAVGPTTGAHWDPDGSDRTVDVDGTPVRVVVRGTGEPLLLVNGIGAHVGTWSPFASELARFRRLVMFDAPGAGGTPVLHGPRRMPGLARFVVRLLDVLGLDEVDLLGFSWGGALAQQLARDASTRIRRLVLVATTPGVCGKPPNARVALAMVSPRRYSSGGLTSDTAALLYGGDYREGGARQGAAFKHWGAAPPSMRGYRHQMYAISGWTSTPWLHRLAQPTLIVAGGDDPLAPSLNARIMGKLIRNSQSHIVPGAGHLWLLDHPRDSARMVETFLAPASSQARPETGAPHHGIGEGSLRRITQA